MNIQRPIFIVGAGRSGSTICHKIFSEHPDVAWLSPLCSTFPAHPRLNKFLMAAIDYPIISKHLRKCFTPDECYDFWEFHCKGFREPCRDLSSDDLTNKTRHNLRDVMSQMLTDKRSRLLVKITGWPRIGFLRALFADALFIHILRDGRALANSLINVDFWRGWKGPQHWRWGELTPSHRHEWEKYQKSFIVLAAIQWKILLHAMERAQKHIETDHFIELKYEHFCSKPLDSFRQLTDFCGLNWSPNFEKSIRSYNIRNTNFKWRKDLTISQQNILNEVLYEHLLKYNYI
ncbi:MAG: sulfotransferase [Thermodesulfobacteriota bacterium]|nr:sulfotransferase [Thermodesulfobacteriota bacterium]